MVLLSFEKLFLRNCDIRTSSCTNADLVVLVALGVFTSVVGVTTFDDVFDVGFDVVP